MSDAVSFLEGNFTLEGAPLVDTLIRAPVISAQGKIHTNLVPALEFLVSYRSIERGYQSTGFLMQRALRKTLV